MKITDFAGEIIDKYEMEWAAQARIKYLLRRSFWSPYQAACYKTHGPWSYLTDWDFVIPVWDTHLKRASEHQLRALLHHELTHVDRGLHAWRLRQHNLIEFHETIDAFGPYNDGLKLVAESMRKWDGKT